MRITDFLVADAINVDLKATDKKGVLAELLAPLAKAGRIADAGRMVEVLLDVEALGRGEQRILYYEMGHGLCSNPYWHQCPHRMACVRRPMYVPGEAAQCYDGLPTAAGMDAMSATQG